MILFMRLLFWFDLFAGLLMLLATPLAIADGAWAAAGNIGGAAIVLLGNAWLMGEFIREERRCRR